MSCQRARSRHYIQVDLVASPRSEGSDEDIEGGLYGGVSLFCDLVPHAERDNCLGCGMWGKFVPAKLDFSGKHDDLIQSPLRLLFSLQSSMSGPGAGFEYPPQEVSWLKRFVPNALSNRGETANNQQEMSCCLRIASAARQTSFNSSMHVLNKFHDLHLLTISGTSP